MKPRPSLACPNCDATDVDWLEWLSQGNWVDYYRCPLCRHVWTVGKDDQGHVHHVTPLVREAGSAADEHALEKVPR